MPSIQPFIEQLLKCAPKFLDELSKQSSKEGNADFQQVIEQLKEIIKPEEDGTLSVPSIIQRIFNLFIPQCQKDEKKQETEQKKDGSDPVATQSITDERLEDGTMRHIETRCIGNRSLSIITLTLSDGTKQTTQKKENIKDEEVEDFKAEWESIMQLE